MVYKTSISSFLIIATFFLSLLFIGALSTSQVHAGAGGEGGAGGGGSIGDRSKDSSSKGKGASKDADDSNSNSSGSKSGSGTVGKGGATSNGNTSAESTGKATGKGGLFGNGGFLGLGGKSGKSNGKGGLFGNGGFLGLGGKSGKSGGFFGGILDGIKGAFSGSKSENTSPSQGFPETGGEGDRSDFQTTPKNIDLVPETQKVTILTDKTTFAGQIKLIETSDPDIQRGSAYSGNSSVTITNKLLVDYGCDSTVDSEQEFTTPFTTLQSGTIRVIPLSTQFVTGDAGDHCFAFEIDTKNAVPEKDEENNKTKWHTFTVEGMTIPDDPTVSTGCPVYQQPICAADEKIIPGGTDANGCQEVPQCISNKPTSPDDISFEVKSYVLSDATGSGVRTRVTTKDWSPDNITLTGDQKLAFRWDASKYNKCLAFIYPETYIFNSNTTAVTGNTEELGITIKNLNHEYSIECTTGDVTHKQTINVTAN